jgi:hypothetical protein
VKGKEKEEAPSYEELLRQEHDRLYKRINKTRRQLAAITKELARLRQEEDSPSSSDLTEAILDSGFPGKLSDPTYTFPDAPAPPTSVLNPFDAVKLPEGGIGVVTSLNENPPNTVRVAVLSADGRVARVSVYQPEELEGGISIPKHFVESLARVRSVERLGDLAEEMGYGGPDESDPV